MADESAVGSVNLVAVDDAVGAVCAGNMAELQPLLLVLKQLPDVNLAHGIADICCCGMAGRKAKRSALPHQRRYTPSCCAFPVIKQLMDTGGVFAGEQAVTELLIAEHLCKFAEDLQMQVGGAFRYQ